MQYDGSWEYCTVDSCFATSLSNSLVVTKIKLDVKSEIWESQSAGFAVLRQTIVQSLTKLI